MTVAVPRPITFQPDIYGKVLHVLQGGKSRSVLDVGAGQEYFSRKLAEDGFTVEACDFDRDNFLCPEIPFRDADLNRELPYKDDTFDCVVSVEVVEHIENHFTYMSEIVRVTKPGGTIVITTPNVLSLSSRWHLFLYGYNDCAPIPLNPCMKDYFMQHINPISLPELMFHIERFGAEVVGVATNRFRRGSVVMMPLLFPLLALSLRRKLLRHKYSSARALHCRHIRWMCTPANLLGRITILVARKLPA